MDIEVQTHVENPALALRQIERWTGAPPEGATWRVTIELRSGAFTAAMPFFFDDYMVDRLLPMLRSMDATLSGRALLRSTGEEPYIALEVSGTGHVLVSGVLIDYAQHPQRLVFSFDTDQTVLAPLVHAFETAQRVVEPVAPAA